MSELFHVDNEADQDLVKKIVEAIKDKEADGIDFTARSLGKQSLQLAIDADNNTVAHYTYDEVPQDAEPVSITFRPNRYIIAKHHAIDSETKEDRLTVMQVVSGKANIGDSKNSKAILTIPEDDRFPAELEIEQEE
jgi:Zn-dependent M16 (insulinase) family peptidase